MTKYMNTITDNKIGWWCGNTSVPYVYPFSKNFIKLFTSFDWKSPKILNNASIKS